MKYSIIVFMLVWSLSLFTACRSIDNQKTTTKNIVLTASKKEAASLHLLELYADNSFTFTNAGMLNARNYKGSYQISADTILLKYTGIEPKVLGKQFLFAQDELVSIDKKKRLRIDSMATDFMNR